MLIGSFGSMDFNKKRKIMTFTGLILLILGITSLTLMAINYQLNLDSFIMGFYAGTGAGLVVAGIGYMIFYGLILKKNAAKRKKLEIEDKDERNNYIKMRTGYIAFYIAIGIQYIALLITGLVNITAFLTIIAVIAVEFLLAFFTYFIMNRLY